MSVNVKYAIWGFGAVLTTLFVVVFASNFALVLTKSHDVGLHLLDVFWLLNSPDAKASSMAKLGLMLGATSIHKSCMVQPALPLKGKFKKPVCGPRQVLSLVNSVAVT